ncbi:MULTISPECIES: Gfo/Idh/MocA family protein [Streptomyces]|uniref:Gfo/Idh/MocA family oxidoreductase n=2 Tax=Streptomyces TaxID=1883 RepID=A0A2U9PBT4_STRAS|nr:Gfo/Idh/MocA family oxidoreductase [Streptomyces actuosus]AWT47300.1 gfo/Idh/MocA family oxidoreductase [Streptomyces actuosus]MBM4823492.1 Gfo/Idh/MocA family oxidoreductase [Streptomyces actuosus]
MSRPLRLGVIGLGAISPYYLAAAQRLPGWELAAVCDTRTETLEEYGGPAARFRDHRALLARSRPDAVIVAVPNHAHLPVCHDALAAGVPVCVEKPLALTATEGHRLVDLARHRDIPLMTAFHRRYNMAVRTLAHQLTGRNIATVRVRYLERIEDHLGGEDWYLDPARCGGGCVADNGPNALDLVRLLLGEVTVTGCTIHRDDHGIDRQAEIRLHSPTGATASVELDWSYPGEVKDIEVELTGGEILHADMLAGHPGFKASLWHEYEAILTEFASLAGGHARSREGAHGGLAALELVEAAYRAARPAGDVTAAEAGR